MPIQFINKESGLNLEVMRRPIRPENIVRRPKIVMKDSEGDEVKSMMRAKGFVGIDEKTGKPIYRRLQFLCPICEVGKADKGCTICKGRGVAELFTNYEKAMTVNGDEIGEEEEVSYWAQKEDGTEEEFPKFEPDSELIVQLELPKSKLNDFYVESWDELEATWKKKKGEKVQDKYAVTKLYEEAERYVVDGIMGAGKFVKARGHQEWYFVCFPTIRDDGTFGWLVGYWQSKIEMKHLMPVPKAVEVAEEKKTPAKSYLPELQAIVG